jgi:hypothetical protein
MGIEDMANAKVIESMEKNKDIEGLEAFKLGESPDSNVAKWAENALKRLREEAESNSTTPEYQTTQIEKYGGSTQEVQKRTEGTDNEIELIKTETENKIKKINEENVEDVPYEEVKDEEKNLGNFEKTTEKIDDAKKEIKRGTTIESSEITEKKPLQPGDEIFKEGKFFKITDISVPSPEEKQYKWEAEKPDRDREFSEMSKLSLDMNLLEERKKFDEQKKQEFEKRNGQKISAIIKGGKGTIAQETIELDPENVIRIDNPEQREKIVQMQKEMEETENRAAKVTGLGAEKKMVDKIIGHPGKF